MHIESISLKNFKSFRDAHMEGIPKLCVLVGANGTGKSTLFSVFDFQLDARKHTNLGRHIFLIVNVNMTITLEEFIALA